MRGRERLSGNLDLLLLATLRAGDAHGYELARRLAARSDGLFEVQAGTIYPALRRLEQRRLVASRWREVRGRRRRVYRLTKQGTAELADEHGRWQRFSSAVGSVLAAPKQAEQEP
jgi:PadR family transcriptional regulator, regulatory protein PadR